VSLLHGRVRLLERGVIDARVCRSCGGVHQRFVRSLEDYEQLPNGENGETPLCAAFVCPDCRDCAGHSEFLIVSGILDAWRAGQQDS
jgi:hypothetical protein